MSISGNDAFCIVDDQAKLIYASSTFNSLFGYTDHEIRERDIFTLIHNDDHHKIETLIYNGVSPEHHYDAIMRTRTKDGDYIVCRTASSRLYKNGADKREVLIHFQKVVLDTSTQQDGNNSEQKFRILFNNAYDAIFLMKDDMFVDCNPRTEVLFGCSRDELLSRKPYDFSPDLQPDGQRSKDKAVEKINKALRGIPQTFEWTHCRKDGMLFDTEVNLNLIEIDGESLLQAVVRDITKRKQTEAELRYRVDFEKFISSISTNFINLTSDEIDEGIHNTLEDIGMFAGVDRSFIFLLDPTATTYSIQYEWCIDGVTSLREREISFQANDVTWWQQKLSQFQNIRIADVAILPQKVDAEIQLLRSFGSQSFLCVPLRIGKTLIGFFGFDSVFNKQQWTIENVDLLRIVGEIIANSIERKRRDGELHRLADQRKHLLEVSTSMLATLNLDEVIRQTLNILNDIIRFDECGIHLLDDKENVLHPYIVVNSHGMHIETKKSPIPVGKGIISTSVNDGKAYLVNHSHLDPRSYYPDTKKIETEHLISVPMKTNDAISGTFTVVRQNDDPFTTDEFELIQLFVGYVSVAIENARLYQTIRKQHSVTAALLQTALSIVEQKDVKEVLTLIAKQTVSITGVDRCSLFIWNNFAEQLDPFVIITPNKDEETLFADVKIKRTDTAIIAKLIERKGPVQIRREDMATLLPANYIEKFSLKSLLVIPFFKNGKLMGSMILDDTREERTFTDDDMKVAIGIANQAAVAIENAFLFEKIKASEERYRSLFEDSKDGVFTSTEDGCIIDINPAGIEMLGYETKEELQNVNIGKDIYANSERREEYKRIIREDGFVKDFEAVLKQKDGKLITCLITSTAFYDTETDKTYFRGFLRNVTEKKKLEDQLRQTQKMESLGQLAGGIAHDFNNVLGIIQASLSAMKNKKNQHQAYVNQYVEMAENAVTRGADVARRLLTFSQSNDIKLRPLFIADVVKDLTNVLKHTIEKNISLETKITSDLPPFMGDNGQVYQMLLNLCLNARDAISENTATMDGGYIRITADKVSQSQVPGNSKLPENSGYIKLSISDNGGGMPEHIRARIFEPFFTTKEAGKGTGLGLSVVYGIVQSHQGFIDVQTEMGKGTTFSMYLPVASVNERCEPEKSELKSIKGGSESIFIVEDEDVLRTLMADVLESKGYRVTAVSDGATALQLFREQNADFDCILLDMGLPKIPGEALFLKMIQINPNANIILASGYLDDELQSNLFELGAKSFIHKPYKPNELLINVRNVLDETKTYTNNAEM